jgi:hypothetical protein
MGMHMGNTWRRPLRVSGLICSIAAAHGWALAAPPAPLLKLDFEQIGCAKSQATCEVGEALLVQGFALRYAPSVEEAVPGALFAVGKSWPFNRKGPTALNINSCSGTVTLLANDNAPFTAIAIALAEMDGEGPVALEFNAQHEDGTEAHHSVKLDKPGWHRVAFPASFKGITSLAWQQGDCVSNKAHMFSQIELQPAPAKAAATP